MFITWKRMLILAMLSWLTSTAISEEQCDTSNGIRLLSYFPCVDDAAVESLGDCDVFVYAAARLAADRVNRAGFLGNTTLNLVPVATGKGDDPYLVVFHSVDSFIDATIHGVIGPASPAVADVIVPLVSECCEVPLVTYSVTDISFNSQEYFYRTLPSDAAINDARSKILEMFQWYRVGLLASADKFSATAGEGFLQTYQRDVGRPSMGVLRVAVSESFQDTASLEAALQRMQDVDLRIIVGIFSSTDARKLLCMAQDYQLTTEDHVWILPSYYNPDWWREDVGDNCSEEDMIDILNSAIFVGPVKQTPLDLSASEFQAQLLQKTRELFPSFAEAELSRFLPHSRATSAYDAVTLTARAWGTVLARNETCSDRNLLRSTLNSSLNCEVCRLYSGCYLSAEQAQSCEVCNQSSPSFEDAELNYYGQVLISQFANGTHRPIGLCWPSNNRSANYGFVRISDLSTHQCVSHLQLDSTTFGASNSCSCDFWWKGRTSPPTSGYGVTNSNISLAALIIVGVLVLCAMAYAVVVLVLNIVWRNNKYIKASSSRMTIVFIVGFLLQMHIPIYDGLSISALEYRISPQIVTVFCNLSQWFGNIGDVIFYGILLVRNYRLYRIFYNKKLMQRGSKLTDRVLLGVVLVLLLPVFVTLTVWTAIDTVQFSHRVTSAQNDYMFVNVTFCASNYSSYWGVGLGVYRVVLIVALLFYAYRNSQIKSRFRDEGVTTRRVLLLAVSPVPFAIAVNVGLAVNTSLILFYLACFWIGVLWQLLIPTIILTTLYLPKFIKIYKDHYEEIQEKEMEEERQQRLGVYNKLMEQAQILKTKLAQKENRIQKLKEGNTVTWSF